MKNQISGSIALDASALAESLTSALLAELTPLLRPATIAGDEAIGLLLHCGLPDAESASHVLNRLSAAGVRLILDRRPAVPNAPTDGHVGSTGYPGWGEQ